MMDRSTFIKQCGLGCMGILSGGLMFQGCVSVKYVEGSIQGSFLTIPESSFYKGSSDKNEFRNVVIVEHGNLQYPLTVFRKSAENYHALLMKCTHQGTELQLFGDRLQCPAHGSEFTSDGIVQNGPADQSLRVFPVTKQGDHLNIDLS